MKWYQKILLAGSVLVLTGMLALPAFAQQVTIALGSEPTTLDPQLREDGGERAVNDNIYETLMVRTPDGAPIEGAELEIWQTADNGLYSNQDEAQPEYNLRAGAPRAALATAA